MGEEARGRSRNDSIKTIDDGALSLGPHTYPPPPFVPGYDFTS